LALGIHRSRIVRRRRVIDAADISYNDELIDAPTRAFVRAVALLRGPELRNGGSFVRIAGDPEPRIHRYQFNYGALSVHYVQAQFDENDAAELREVFSALCEPYLAGDGASIGMAIDRLGSAAVRSDGLDSNLDLCIAAEIAFTFGARPRNSEIMSTVRENARIVFGDEEFYWDRDRVRSIVLDSYTERGYTVHGTGRPDRGNALEGLNAQLRAILQSALRAYIERRPTEDLARRSWSERRAALRAGRLLGPIFVA
jgi:hypothetical protein